MRSSTVPLFTLQIPLPPFRLPRVQVLQLYPEVRRTIEEAKQRREAETKAASSVMEEELARSSTRPRKRAS